MDLDHSLLRADLISACGRITNSAKAVVKVFCDPSTRFGKAKTGFSVLNTGCPPVKGHVADLIAQLAGDS